MLVTSKAETDRYVTVISPPAKKLAAADANATAAAKRNYTQHA